MNEQEKRLAANQLIAGILAREPLPGPPQTAPEGERVARDIVFVAAHGGEGLRYRVEGLAGGLARLGFDVSTLAGHRVGRLGECPAPRVVVMYHAANHPVLPYARMALSVQSRGGIVVVDHDEPVFDSALVMEMCRAYSMGSKETSLLLEDSARYRELLLLADLATAPTRSLADAAGQWAPRTCVIPSSLDDNSLCTVGNVLDSRLSSAIPASRLVVICHNQPQREDFDECVSALERFLRERPEAELKLIGDMKLSKNFDDLSSQITHLPSISDEALLREIASADINIVPLKACGFNDAKGGEGAFSAGALGLPSIVSNTAGFGDYIRNGENGILVNGREQWYEALSRFADDLELRMRIGRKARDAVLEQNNSLSSAVAAVQAYGLPLVDTTSVPASQKATPHPDVLRLNWVLSELRPDEPEQRKLFGLIGSLANLGHDVSLYFPGAAASGEELLHRLHESGNRIKAIAHTGINHMQKCDALIACHWATKDFVERFRTVSGLVINLVQNDAVDLEPPGTARIMADNWYRGADVRLAFGAWCESFLRRRYGGAVWRIDVPVDHEAFYPKVNPDENKSLGLVLHANQDEPVNCFRLSLDALARLVRIRPKTRITLFGPGCVEAGHLPFPAKILNYVTMPVEYGEIYRNADLGLSLSASCPGERAYEMLACGLPVADLAHNDNASHYGDRDDIALLLDSDPDAMAGQLAELLDNSRELETRRENGLEFAASLPGLYEVGRQLESLLVHHIAQSSVIG